MIEAIPLLQLNINLNLPAIIIQQGLLKPPGTIEIVYVCFLFLLSIFILNVFFNIDFGDVKFNLKSAALLTLGSFIMLIAILSPDIFVFIKSGIFNQHIKEGLLPFSILFILLFSGYAYIVARHLDKSNHRYINTLFVVVSNYLWIVPLVIIGRTWYWNPQSQGYFGGFYSTILFFYFPLITVLILLKLLSIKLTKKITNGVLARDIKLPRIKAEKRTG
ncbi:MAG: hypothetical protein K8T10_11900 [Candidatus Eremiobacteraeota bacterium]|nr:hypothetical protein [Candidatus Eremiobacteraeota bacterium]